MRKWIETSEFRKIGSINFTTYTFVYRLLLIFLLMSHTAMAQQVIQLKLFTEDLQPYGNISLSINQGPFVKVPASGAAYVNLSEKQFPVKTIITSDNTLEAASWNFSKGILEVTIRKKSYLNIDVVVLDSLMFPLSGIEVKFIGEKTAQLTTNSRGVISLPLGLNEKVTSKSQFKVGGYEVLKFINDKNSYQLIIKELGRKKLTKKSTSSNGAKSEIDWDLYVSERLQSLDSIQEFYTFLNTIPRELISATTQESIDLKFEQLIALVKGNLSTDTISYITNITDKTNIDSTIDYFLKQARKEGERLSEERIAFEEKIQLVRDKLNFGFENMSNQSKEDLLKDINLLESVLTSNKSDFVDNQNSYKAIIDELRRRFLDQKALESKLSQSEQKRLEEKRKYQERILAILGVVLLFALLIILLFYLRTRLKKQQYDLIEANKTIKNTNENLEFIVSERTHLLQQTFKELDLVLYRASHDLRAPICSIAGLSDLIARDSGNQELTELVLKTNQQMDKLLKKLSTISEIHQPGDYQLVDVNSLLKAVLSRFDEQLENGTIVLKIKIEKNLSFKTIPMLLESIFFHLLENAIFFSQVNQENRAEVTLEVQLNEKELKIRIEDNGIGIETVLLPKLFDMFFKGTEYSKGNGLGLYIVKKSVDLLSGEIEIDTSIDHFTSISVAIPLDLSKSHVLEFLKEAKAT